MSKHIEDYEQQAIFDWAKVKTIQVGELKGKLSDYLLAIPNGGKRNPREAARLKKQGVKAGVSDIFLPVPTGKYAGLWIELKKPRNAFKTESEIKRAATEKQRDWISLMRFAGYQAVLCYGFNEAKIEIESYLIG